jgi:threonine dehydrogenase-like Zn-dependent dehydrogenase
LRQVFQSLADGTTTVIDVPAPQVVPGHVLIRSQASIISAGTERMLVDFGRANLLDKARQQPDRVKDVIDKARTDGLGPTYDAVRSKLDRPITLGYANAGVVLEVGPGVTDLEPGDVVASNGSHAEVVSVPRNLVVKVPEREGAPVPAEEAAFASIGAIALQGVRLAAPTLGERFVVTGLGLVGLLTVQLLRAHGCQVLGLDLDAQRLKLAEQFGAQTLDVSGGADPVAIAEAFSDGLGVDGVIVTASTKSSEPMRQAAQMCRKRGRLVLVGVTGLELRREDFYEKELSFQVSASYGPGRYDPAYEVEGQDYPPGFVRWTAGRNLEAFLDLVADGRVELSPLITNRYPLADAPAAYTALSDDPDALGIALTYPETSSTASGRGPAAPPRRRGAGVGAPRARPRRRDRGWQLHAADAAAEAAGDLGGAGHGGEPGRRERRAGRPQVRLRAGGDRRRGRARRRRDRHRLHHHPARHPRRPHGAGAVGRQARLRREAARARPRRARPGGGGVRVAGGEAARRPG